MTHVIPLLTWQLLCLVVGVAAPSAAFGAWWGARMAIATCSRHWDCNMAKAGERVGWTNQLKRQHEELMREHPDALKIRREAEDADRAEHVGEQAKDPASTRAKQDVERDWHS